MRLMQKLAKVIEQDMKLNRGFRRKAGIELRDVTYEAYSEMTDGDVNALQKQIENYIINELVYNGTKPVKTPQMTSEDYSAALKEFKKASYGKILNMNPSVAAQTADEVIKKIHTYKPEYYVNDFCRFIKQYAEHNNIEFEYDLLGKEPTTDEVVYDGNINGVSAEDFNAMDEGEQRKVMKAMINAGKAFLTKHFWDANSRDIEEAASDAAKYFLERDGVGIKQVEVAGGKLVSWVFAKGKFLMNKKYDKQIKRNKNLPQTSPTVEREDGTVEDIIPGDGQIKAFEDEAYDRVVTILRNNLNKIRGANEEWAYIFEELFIKGRNETQDIKNIAEEIGKSPSHVHNIKKKLIRDFSNMKDKVVKEIEDGPQFVDRVKKD